ncbi:DMT family transporter [Streptomyces sp. NPDC020096]
MSVFLPGVGGACCLGVGFVLQQRQAQRARLSDSLFFRLLLGLMRYPEWLVGIAAMIAGMALSTIALANGEVSLVEPLTATNLLFAMALSRWLTGQPLGWNGWGGVLLLALGVTGFIVAGQPSEGGHLAGIASGVGIIGDRLRVTPGALAVQTVGLVAIVIGIVLIGRHPCVAPRVPQGR